MPTTGLDYLHPCPVSVAPGDATISVQVFCQEALQVGTNDSSPASNMKNNTDTAKRGASGVHAARRAAACRFVRLARSALEGPFGLRRQERAQACKGAAPGDVQVHAVRAKAGARALLPGAQVAPAHGGLARRAELLRDLRVHIT